MADYGPWPADRMRRWVDDAKTDALRLPLDRGGKWAAAYAADVDLLLGWLGEYQDLAGRAAETEAFADYERRPRS